MQPEQPLLKETQIPPPPCESEQPVVERKEPEDKPAAMSVPPVVEQKDPDTEKAPCELVQAAAAVEQKETGAQEPSCKSVQPVDGQAAVEQKKPETGVSMQPGYPDTQMPATSPVSEQAGGEPETQKPPAVSVQPVVDGQVNEPLVEQKEPENQKPPSVTALPVPMPEDEAAKAKALVLALAAQMATELPPVTPVQPPQSASQDVPPVEVEKGHSLHASPGFPSAPAIVPTPTAPEKASAAGADAPTPLTVPVKTEPEPQMPAPATPPEKVTFLFSDNEASDNERSGSVNKSQEASSCPSSSLSLDAAASTGCCRRSEPSLQLLSKEPPCRQAHPWCEQCHECCQSQVQSSPPG